jgi:hypothetical protein
MPGNSAHTLPPQARTLLCVGLLLSFTNVPAKDAPAIAARLRGLTVAPPACDAG